MKILPALILSAGLLHAQPAVPGAPQEQTPRAVVRALGTEAPDSMIAARRRALEIAGAFSNGGFKLRDGVLMGELQPDKPVIVEVNVFKGNEYWFTAATQTTGSRPEISIHDHSGAPLPSSHFEDENAAATGIVAAKNGPLYLRIALAAGPATPFAAVYSYK